MVRPILFNGDMVRVILEGRKTVTRRVIKPQFEISLEGTECECSHEKGFWDMGGNEWACRQCGYGVIPMRGGSWIHAPYCAGDILYVRETWGTYAGNWWEADYFLYRGDYPNGATSYEFDGHVCDLTKWHPSIHMPKAAARIWLKVTDVRVERLQKITLDQIEKEGVKTEYPHELNGKEQQYAFSQLWDSTIDKLYIDRYGWSANPWVWVIEFERCGKPEEAEG